MASAAQRGKGRGRFVALSFFPAGDEPPKEFRIFTAGLNSTKKGTFLFDEKAAADVMAAFAKHGADLMLDLEHLSIDEDSPNFDPDARGWCRLEVRNGELWAAGVSWTADGDARLREKRQRYVSPVFGFDPATRRISEILNIAITALPATDKPEALIAASARLTQGESPMNPEQFSAVAEALGLGADANIEDVLATIAAMVKKVQNAANGEGEPEPPEDMAPAEGTPEAMAAAAPPVVAAARIQVATRMLARLSGKKEIGQVVAEVEAWRKSHLELAAERAKLATERATLESSERCKLVAALVRLKAETPATAWAKDKDGIPDGKTPVERLANEPIAELRARVAALSLPNGTRDETPRPPPKTGGTEEKYELSERELAMCTERKIDPAKYAATRAAIRARSNTTGA
jgi:hypothetical protein